MKTVSRKISYVKHLKATVGLFDKFQPLDWILGDLGLVDEFIKFRVVMGNIIA